MSTRIDIIDNGPLEPKHLLRILLAALVCALVVGFLAGCVTACGGDPLDQATHVIKLGDGKLFGVTIPQSVLKLGRDAARSYVAANYPLASGFVDQLFPVDSDAGDTIEGRIVYDLDVAVQLTNSVIIPATDIATIYVSEDPRVVMPQLPPSKRAQYSPGEFAAKFLREPTAPASPVDVITDVVVGVVSNNALAQPVPAHTDLEEALEDLAK